VGECAPGVNICRGGMLVCEGAIDPIPEECNSLDDDCDGTVDEGLPLGGPCGTDEGLCMAGMLQCISGSEVCVGEVPPVREACDCDDNDCDATIDEEPDTGELCPPGSTCVECQCALPCMESEFGFTCPTGKAPLERDGECFCVADRCNDDECRAETIERDGEVLCGPDDEDPVACTCKNNECTFPCDGVVCADGTVCDPRDPAGRCVEDSCRALGCDTDEICDPLSGECGPDPCASVDCAEGEACRDGVCETSCASVECAEDESCEAGACVDDPCVGVTCGSGETCDPSDGSCVDDGCAGVFCARGLVCDPLTGECEVDPCLSLRCPEGEVCEDGECTVDTGPDVDAGVDAGTGFDAGTTEDPHRRVAATGGGGCKGCTVPGGGDGRTPAAPLGMALAVAAWLLIRRRGS